MPAARPDPRPSDLGDGVVRGLSRDHAALVARSLKVLANATRLQLLSVIIGAPGGRATVRTMTEAVALRQPTVSQHLHLMHEAGVVEREPLGREVWYSVHPDLLDTVTELVT